MAADPPTFTPVDLSQQLSRPWDGYRPWTTWNGPPGGQQVFDGVPFQIDGVIQLKTMNSRSGGEYHATRVEGIPVGRRFTQLHLLHFTELVAPHGEPVARLTLHYADGQEHSFDLRYGVHFQDWNHPVDGTEAADPNSHYAWMAPPRDDPNGPMATTLWQTVLPNPRPDVEVVSLSLHSLFGQARYNLAAATTQTGGAPASEQPLLDERPIPEVNEPLEQRVRFCDAADGQPIAHVQVEAWSLEEGRLVKWGRYDSDTRGEVTIDFPPEGGEELELLAADPRHRFSWVFLKSQNPPVAPPPTFKLVRGQTIGGTVQDEQGRPVAGVTVTLSGLEDDGYGRAALAEWPPVRTGADGRWSLDCALPFPNVRGQPLTITLRHADFLPATYQQTEAAGAGALAFRAEDLFQSNAIFRLQAGEELQGIVTAAGAPVARAEVVLFLGEAPDAVPRRAHTDATGRFDFRALESGPARLLVTAEGFAPELTKLEPKVHAITVALHPAKPVQAVVRDAAGQPLAHALFELTAWKDETWLRHVGFSDAQGQFRWDSAPADGADFLVFCRGFRPLTDVTLTAGGAPRELTLERLLVGGPGPRFTPQSPGTPLALLGGRVRNPTLLGLYPRIAMVLVSWMVALLNSVAALLCAALRLARRAWLALLLAPVAMAMGGFGLWLPYFRQLRFAWNFHGVEGYVQANWPFVVPLLLGTIALALALGSRANALGRSAN